MKRTQNPPAGAPFFNVPLRRARPCANATSAPVVIARSRISYSSGGWNIAKASTQFASLASRPTRRSGPVTSNVTMSGA